MESIRPGLLIVTTTFPRWKNDPGPAPFVFHHARALLDYFDVTVLAPHHEGAAPCEEMDGVRVKRFRYALPSSLELLADGAGIRNNMRKGPGYKLLAPALVASELAALRRIIAREKLGHINSHWLIPSGLLGCLAAPPPARHVITVHAADYDLLKRLPGGKGAIRWMAGRASHVVCVSERLADGVREASGGAARVTTMPMGVSLNSFSFSKASRAKWRSRLEVGEKPLMLFAGKLSPKKGVDVLLRALSSPDLTRMGAVLAVAGGGELRAKLEHEAASLGLGGGVKFLGPLPNAELAELYSASDLVVVPSVVDERGETEGMPVVILEALAASRPVVASRACSPPPDLVGRGVTVTGVGDHLELARALADAIANRTRVDADRVKEYDVSRVAKRYAELLLGEGR